MGRLVRVVDALGGETSYVYDAVGNKISQSDPNGHTTSWTYDALDRVESRTLPGGQTEFFTYDANGNMLTQTDFNGNTSTCIYDEKNRLLEKSYADGSAINYIYTLTGKKSSVTDSLGTIAYLYDLRDRMIEVSNPDGSVLSYAYDANGNRTAVETTSGQTVFDFDELNRIVTVTDPDGGITSYQYDDVGNRSTVAHPNGTVTSYAYNNLNRLTNIENRKSTSEIISSYDYSLGPAGNRLQLNQNDGRIVNYTYDALYRLVEEEIIDAVLGNEIIRYTYDAFGNRLTKTDGSGVTEYTYDVNDRLVTENDSSGNFIYTYDANGNTMTKSDGIDTTLYSYDFENRLTEAQTNISTIQYQYDPDGIRVSSAVNGVATNYVVDKNRDSAQVLEERDGSGALIVSYVYGDDLISQQRGGANRYYLYDGQMSTRQLVDTNENITDEYTFDAFGIILDQAGTTANNYLYTGEQYDPNVGFYYLRARYYNQNNGRFLTVDPWKGSPYEPVSLHKYLYANASPLNYFDPSGNFSMSFGMTIAISIALYAITLNALSWWMHLSSNMEEIIWDGFMLIAGGGAGLGGGAVMEFDLTSERLDNGKKVRVLVLALMGGLMIGPSPITYAGYSVSFKTRDNWFYLFGSGAGTAFNGLASIVCGSLTAPVDWLTLTSISLGQAVSIGATSVFTGELGGFGIDVGGDALMGISFVIYSYMF